MCLIPCVMIALLASSQSAPRLPSIYKEPNYEVYFKEGENVELPCEADGDPKPVFEWTKNDAVFDFSGSEGRIIQSPGSGTLNFEWPEEVDEGLYQCFASNDFGRSASKKVHLLMGKLGSFIKDPPTDHRAALGGPLTLPCVPPESVPPASVVWATKERSGGFSRVNYDSRVSVDREYRLRFTNVVEADANKGLPYLCIAMNNITRGAALGPFHYIRLMEVST